MGEARIRDRGVEAGVAGDNGLVGLPSPVPREAGHYAPRNSEAGKDDDSQNHRRPHGNTAPEIKQNALNIHGDSVNPVGPVCKVTLVSNVIRGVRNGRDFDTF